MLWRGPRKPPSVCRRVLRVAGIGTPNAGGVGFDPCEMKCDVSLPRLRMRLFTGFARKVGLKNARSVGVGSEELPWNS